MSSKSLVDAMLSRSDELLDAYDALEDQVMKGNPELFQNKIPVFGSSNSENI